MSTFNILPVFQLDFPVDYYVGMANGIMLGSLLALAISVGVGRIMNMEFRLPELPFRALRYGKLILMLI